MLLGQSRTRTARSPKYIFRRHPVEIQGVFLCRNVVQFGKMYLWEEKKMSNKGKSSLGSSSYGTKGNSVSKSGKSGSKQYSNSNGRTTTTSSAGSPGHKK
jgi:hypothetical protein